MTIEKYIQHLQQDKQKLQDQINKLLINLFFRILSSMAEKQIKDTGYARALIVKHFADKFDKKFSPLIANAYNYWEKHGFPQNVARRPENVSEGKIPIANVNGQSVVAGGTYYYTDNIPNNNQDLNVNIEVTDNGIINQELGLGSKTTRAAHITRTLKEFDNENQTELIAITRLLKEFL